jgi:hypothetical protein
MLRLPYFDYRSFGSKTMKVWGGWSFNMAKSPCGWFPLWQCQKIENNKIINK